MAESNIQLYSTLGTVCLIISIVAFALAIFFFFYFDIPAIFALKTGRAKKKTLERIQKQNSYTDKIRRETFSGSLGSRPQASPAARNVSIADPESTGKRDMDTVSLNEATDTSLLSNTADTSLLNKEADTSVLSQESGATSLLGASAQAVHGKQRSLDPQWKFDILEEIVMIHTNELI